MIDIGINISYDVLIDTIETIDQTKFKTLPATYNVAGKMVVERR